jgi:chromosome segregation ATPase
MDQENTMSDWKLNRMKKSDIITLLRKTEEKLAGFTASANKAVVEIEELNERIDDHMIQEDMNVKTINELNESNKKLMEKVKFYQNQKENNKKRENKISDYFEKGMLEKIEGLEQENKELQGEIVRLEGLSKQRFFENEKLKKEMNNLKETFELGSQCAEDVHNSFYEKIKLLENEKEELIEECKEKNEKNEQLEEEVQKWKEQVEENYKHHWEQLEPYILMTDTFKEVKKMLGELNI